MTATGRRCIAAGALAATLGAACSSGGGSSTDAARLRSSTSNSVAGARPSAPAPARAAPIADPVVPDPVVETVPAPRVIDGGRDGEAIVRSLIEYGRWLERRHPDPALVDRAYERGSLLARHITAEVATLRKVHQRIREIDTSPLDVEQMPSAPNVLSFRVTEHLARRELVDASGRVLQRAGPATERYLISVMRFAARDRWRLNLVQRQGPEVEVQL